MHKLTYRSRLLTVRKWCLNCLWYLFRCSCTCRGTGALFAAGTTCPPKWLPCRDSMCQRIRWLAQCLKQSQRGYQLAALIPTSPHYALTQSSARWWCNLISSQSAFAPLWNSWITFCFHRAKKRKWTKCDEIQRDELSSMACLSQNRPFPIRCRNLTKPIKWGSSSIREAGTSSILKKPKSSGFSLGWR